MVELFSAFLSVAASCLPSFLSTTSTIDFIPLTNLSTSPTTAPTAAALAASPMSAPSLVTLASVVRASISCSKASLAPLITLLTDSIVLLLAFFASDISPDSAFNLFLVVESPFSIVLKCSPTLLFLSSDLTAVSPKVSPIALPKIS
ncbi:hypothetical protein bpuCAU1_001657 (plasmid) [Borrelia puertoricensis]